MRDNAWLSVLGLYKFYPDLFADLTIPRKADLDLSLPYMESGVEDLSVDTLIFKILMDLAELPLVYTDPESMRYMIGRWSAARTPIWRELWKTTLYKYSPIWNKDGSYTETRNLETTGNTSGSASPLGCKGLLARGRRHSYAFRGAQRRWRECCRIDHPRPR